MGSFLRLYCGLIVLLLLAGCFMEVIPQGEYYSPETNETVWVFDDGIIFSELRTSKATLNKINSMSDKMMEIYKIEDWNSFMKRYEYSFGMNYQYSLKDLPPATIQEHKELLKAQRIKLGPAPSSRISFEAWSREWFWNGQEIISRSGDRGFTFFKYLEKYDELNQLK